MSARDAILNKLKASQQPSGAAQAVTFHTADALCAQIDAHFDARRVEVSHAELLQQMQHALQLLQASLLCQRAGLAAATGAAMSASGCEIPVAGK
jgi:hypothetical protein